MECFRFPVIFVACPLIDPPLFSVRTRPRHLVTMRSCETDSLCTPPVTNHSTWIASRSNHNRATILFGTCSPPRNLRSKFPSASFTLLLRSKEGSVERVSRRWGPNCVSDCHPFGSFFLQGSNRITVRFHSEGFSSIHMSASYPTEFHRQRTLEITHALVTIKPLLVGALFLQQSLANSLSSLLSHQSLFHHTH